MRRKSKIKGFFPGGSSGKEPACQCRRCRGHRFDSWVGKISWRRKWQPTLVFLPGKSHRQRSLQATVHRVANEHTWLIHFAVKPKLTQHCKASILQ